MHGDKIAESPNNMLPDYFDITERVFIERTHRVKKRDKSRQKFLNYKDKRYILKTIHYLKHTNIYVYEKISKETMAIRKSL